MGNRAMVVVLMSTFNGEKFLEEQIESVLNQEGVDIKLIIRDDGSTDGTQNILKMYANMKKLFWYTGENLKPAKSFMDLLIQAGKSDYYAFCDQDDYWMPDKLIIAIKKLRIISTNIPALYYGHPRLVDEDLNSLENISNTFEKMLDCNSALINSKATGCTMVFNECLYDLLIRQNPDYIPMHDAWVHKVCLFTGGTVVFDDDVHILYRQHTNNAVGVPKTILGKLKLYTKEFASNECMRSRCIESLLKIYGDKMTLENKKNAEVIANYRNSILNTIKLLFNHKIRTNYRRRNILFKISVLFRKF